MTDIDKSLMERLKQARETHGAAVLSDGQIERIRGAARRRRWRFATGALIAAVCMTSMVAAAVDGAFENSPAPHPAPAVPPDLNEPIAYVAAAQFGGPGIPTGHLVISGTNQGHTLSGARTLATSGRTVADPALDEAGDTLAVVLNPTVGADGLEGELAVVPVNGGGRVRVLTLAGAGSPCWLSGGRDVAFLEAGSIKEIDRDGTGLRSLDVPVRGSSLACSPDGRYLAVTSGDPSRIAVVNVVTRRVHWITPKGTEQFDPAWSPTGDRLAYAESIKGRMTYDSIVSSTRSGHDPRELTTCRGECTQDILPTWSPDGDEIAFVRNIGGILQIYTVGTTGTGGGAHRLTNGPLQHSFPSW